MSLAATSPRSDRRLARLAYRAAHATRMGWYSGLYRLSRTLTKPTPAAPGVAERMPSMERLRADLDALIAQDLANIEAGLYRMPEDVLPGPSSLRQAARYIADLHAVDRRRHARDGQEVFRSANQGQFTVADRDSNTPHVKNVRVVSTLEYYLSD